MAVRAGDVFACGPFTTTAHPTFDFETYSEAGFVWNGESQKWGSLPGLSAQNRGLPAVGARNYVQHPTFEVLRLAYDLLDGQGMRHWLPGMPPPADICAHVEAGKTLEAVNVGFEWTVWNFFCVPKLGWPTLPQSQVVCCAAKARAAAYPGSLEPMGEVLFPSAADAHLRKDKTGKDLIRLLTVPKNPTKANQDLRWTPFTQTEKFQQFYSYNDQDVVAELAASLRLPDLTPHEMDVWRLDFRVNMRGMHVATRDVENCIVIIEQAYAKYNAELSAITGGAVSSASEGAKTLAWLGSRGVHLYELDEESVTDALKKRAHMDGTAVRVLEIRQILALGSVKKLYAFRAQTTAQGRLHDQYVYYGAHTGLWNGRGVQPANLYSGIFKRPEQVEHALALIAVGSIELLEFEYGPHGSWVAENPKDHKPAGALEVIASCLRSMIIAAPGHRLISADFSAIQAVVTSALAGEEWRLEVFRTHGKIYEAMAARLTGNPLQFYLDYKKQNGKHHEHRQNPGKLAVLSGDFGAWIDGWKRFGADKLLGADENIKAAIMKTRNAQPMIVELWGGQTRDKFQRTEHAQLFGLEGAAISAVLEPGNAFAYRNQIYQVFEDVLYCQLPSEGFMRYHTPRLSKAQPRGRYTPAPWELSLSYSGWNSNQLKGAGGWVRMDLYGGVLTQNNVSHEAREYQAAKLLALEAAGYPITFHNHDENAAEVPMGQGSVEEYLAIMRTELAWACTPDGKPWPVKVPDAWEQPRYGKWEFD